MAFRKTLLTAVLVFSFLAHSVCGVTQSAKQPDPSQAEIRTALASFLLAFNNLDWPAFRGCFAADATMFHPAVPNVKRIDTPEEFEKAWLGVFARIKKSSGRNAPPYMNLQPLDLRIQMLSQEIALVTLHLVDGPTVSRRTIIFKRYADGWKIVHIHASNITVSESIPASASPKN
jgi:ketosteroid isomerase-like protein